MAIKEKTTTHKGNGRLWRWRQSLKNRKSSYDHPELLGTFPVVNLWVGKSSLIQPFWFLQNTKNIIFLNCIKRKQKLLHLYPGSASPQRCPRACEYVTLHSKRGLTSAELRLRVLILIQGGPGQHKVLIRRSRGQREMRRCYLLALKMKGGHQPSNVGSLQALERARRQMFPWDLQRGAQP